MPFQHLSQPGNFLFVAVILAVGIGTLVQPVSTNTQLSVFVHGMGTNLHFKHLAFRADHGGMQGAVTIFLGIGDVVVELVGNMAPERVHGSQRGVTIAQLGHQNADSTDVVYLGEIEVFATHFTPDAVDVFGSTIHITTNPITQQFFPQYLHHTIHIVLAGNPFFIQQARNLFIGVGLQIAKRQIFQFPFEMTNPQTVRQRRIDIKHLFSHFFAAIWRSVLHSTNGGCTFGQLDQRHSDVINHGNQHLTQVVDLGFALPQHDIIRRVLNRADGRHAQHTLDQFGNGATKITLYPCQRQPPFPYGTVKHGGHQRLGIQPQIHQQLCHFNAHLHTVNRPVGLIGNGFIGQLFGQLQCF